MQRANPRAAMLCSSSLLAGGFWMTQKDSGVRIAPLPWRQDEEDSSLTINQSISEKILESQWQDWQAMAHVRVNARSKDGTDGTTGGLLLFNKNAIPIDNEVFQGELSMTVDPLCGQQDTQGAENDDKKPQLKPTWSMILTGQFKRQIRGNLMCGFELPSDPDLGYVGHSLATVALHLGEIFSGKPIRYSLFEKKPHKPFIVVRMLDYYTMEELDGDGTVRLQYDNFSLDFLRLKCVQIPAVSDFSIANWLPRTREDPSRLRMSLVVYEEYADESQTKRNYLFKADIEYAMDDQGTVKQDKPLVSRSEFCEAMRLIHAPVTFAQT